MPDDPKVDPTAEGDLKHVWARFMIMPVKVYRTDEESEPYVEYVKEEVQAVIDDPDKAINCMVCYEPLETAWGKPCSGPRIDMGNLTRMVAQTEPEE